ncbi:sigma-70 family RNA polymerase sigma factor [Enterovirga rhinocerotis]|uniref:RNA polymerase sigma-70 factor (ECF subfamily) n=1 Tax=Enterovirga rhinocerotis TaxID=1339210 RepID=A0A4R7BQ21_9HYPH|nr:sigma-70 family RNA polymerase sigma factor [Enterovirga rhinocerotis]TDR87243.1 RNA polymerase sigma-70 factor (ECF subfamily) [Enterovirga rhinocerotis]
MGTDPERRDELGAAVRGCAAGDRSALRLIYERESRSMLGVAKRVLHRQALAEEAVQDTFVRVWQHAASFDSTRGSARTWLYAILRNRALNILRSERKTDLVDDFEPMALESGEERADAMVERLSEAGRLRRCLEGLDPIRRRAVLLAYAGGLTHGELAGRLGVPLGTMKSWMRRSLILLRRCMA